jgi:hypothetical protein
MRMVESITDEMCGREDFRRVPSVISGVDAALTRNEECGSGRNAPDRSEYKKFSNGSNGI